MLPVPSPGGVGSSREPSSIQAFSSSNLDNAEAIVPAWFFDQFAVVNSSNPSDLEEIEILNPKDPKVIQKSIEGLSTLIANDPMNTTHLKNRGQQYSNLYQLDKSNKESLKKAEEDFKAALTIDKRDPEAMYWSGWVDLQNQSYQKAITRFQLRLNLKKDDDVKTNKALGEAYLKTGNYNKSLECLTVAYENVDRGSSEEEEICETIDLAFEHTVSHFRELIKKGDLVRATELVTYDESVYDALNTNDTEIAHSLLAEVYVKRNWPESAKDHLNDPEHASDIDLLARCYFLTGEFDCAKDVYVEALAAEEVSLSKEEREQFLMKAALNSFLYGADRAEYFELKDKLKKEFPESACLKFLNAYEIYYEGGDTQKVYQSALFKSKTLFLEYLKVFPFCPYGNFYIAKVLSKSGARQEAIKFLNIALSANPYDYKALELRGKILEESGDFKSAWNDYKTCINHIELSEDHDVDTYEARKIIAKHAYYVHLAGDRQEAIRLFSLLLDLDTKNKTITKSVCYSYAKLLYDVKRYEEALKLFTSIRSKDLTLEDPYDIWIVKCHIGIGTEEALVAACTICKSYNKNNPEFDALHKIVLEKRNSLVQPKPKTVSQQTVKPAEQKPKKVKNRPKPKPAVPSGSTETEEQKAERLKKEAEAEEARKENQKKLEADRLQKEDEERRKLEVQKSLEKLAAQEEAERLKQERFLKSKSRNRDVFSGTTRSGKSSLATDFQKQKAKWKAEEAKAISQSAAEVPPAPRPISPPRLVPPPIVQFVNNKLKPSKTTERAFDPSVLQQPIASIHIDVLKTDVVIPMKANHIERIRGAIETLEAVVALVHTNAPREVLERLILIKLYEFDRIISAQEDTEFSFFIKKIISETNFKIICECIRSPALVHSNLMEFARLFIGSTCVVRLLEFKYQKNWPTCGSENDERINHLMRKITDDNLLGFINTEINILHNLSEKAKTANLTEDEKTVFRQCLRNILQCSNAIKGEYLRNLNRGQLNVEGIEKFLQRNDFASGWAVAIAERLAEHTTTTKPQSVSLDFLDD